MHNLHSGAVCEKLPKAFLFNFVKSALLGTGIFCSLTKYQILKSFCQIYLTKSNAYDIINTTGGDIVAKNLKLKSARAAMDMSQQALAEKVGVSRQTINAIEKGDYNPTLNLCISICRALGKTLDEVFWDGWIDS